MKKSLITAVNFKDIAAEAYRELRTIFQYRNEEMNKQVVLITSYDSGVGKTTVCANLGIVLAQKKKKVIVIDANLRKPSLTCLFDMKKDCGLSSLIKNFQENNTKAKEQIMESIIKVDEIDGLFVLPSGPIHLCPTELIDSYEMRQLVHFLREEFDHILIDSPSLGNSTDALVLSHFVDGVILVAEYLKTTDRKIMLAIEQIKMVDAQIMGVVITKAKLKRKLRNQASML